MDQLTDHDGAERAFGGRFPRRIAVVMALVMAAALPPLVALAQPPIPHSLEGREECLACHETGVAGAPQVPSSHTGRPNEVCQACHQPLVAQPSPVPTSTPPLVPTPIQFPQAPGENFCLECHRGLGGMHEAITLAWETSIHAQRGVGCADCHGGDPGAADIGESMSLEAGFIGTPAKDEIPALCASCHANVDAMRQYDLPTDQYAKYLESIHGLRLAGGDPNVATCYDCHDGHGTLETNDPSADVYPSNVPGLCASCHADQDLMRPYGVPTNQYELYMHSVHGVALLQEQDLRAPSCATCHGTHGAAPPGFAEVANVCGSCHGATQDYYLRSQHAGGSAGAPKCVTCHGRYDVLEPTRDMFLGTEVRNCGQCHDSGSEAGQVVQALYDRLTSAAASFESAEDAIGRAARIGMITAPQRARLQEARTHLITAEAAQHATQLALVEEQTDQAISISEEVQQTAEGAIRDSVVRRQAMVVAVAAIGLVVAALYVVKRQLDRQLE